MAQNDIHDVITASMVVVKSLKKTLHVKVGREDLQSEVMDLANLSLVGVKTADRHYLPLCRSLC